MFGMTGIVLPDGATGVFKNISFVTFGDWNKALLEKPYYSNRIIFCLVAFGLLSIVYKNSQELLVQQRLKPMHIAWVGVTFLFAVIYLGDNPQFLYFNF